MQAITVFSGFLSRSARSAAPEFSAYVASSSSRNQSNTGTWSTFTAMQTLMSQPQTAIISRHYSNTTACNARRVRWDTTIKKWDISGSGFDAFVETKEKIDEQGKSVVVQCDGVSSFRHLGLSNLCLSLSLCSTVFNLY